MDRLREFSTLNEYELDEKAKLLKDSDAKLEGLKLEDQPGQPVAETGNHPSLF